MQMTAYTRDTVNAPNNLRHHALAEWVAEVATLTDPARIHWADGGSS
jgi:GTP-dependent phosphoenolpyruvate carboxykinase